MQLTPKHEKYPYLDVDAMSQVHRMSNFQIAPHKRCKKLVDTSVAVRMTRRKPPLISREHTRALMRKYEHLKPSATEMIDQKKTLFNTEKESIVILSSAILQLNQQKFKFYTSMQQP